MKLIVAVIIAILSLLLYILGQSNKEAYEACVKEGVMSNETCYHLAYT